MSPLPVDQAAATTSQFARSVFRLFTRADDDDAKCHPQPNIDLCEKPNAANNTTTIVLSVLGGTLFVGTFLTLAFLHLRHKRRDEREWPKNNQELDDYGVGPMPSSTARQPSKPKNTYRQPRVDDDDDVKNGQHLPPPGRRDSLRSLARSIRGNPDAYRSRPDDTSHGMKPVEPMSGL